MKRTLLPFVLTTAVVFALLAAALYAVGFVPERPAAVPEEPAVTEAAPTAELLPAEEPLVPVDTTPVRITVGAIGVDTVVVTPLSTDADVLDRALLSGAVHYPSSVGAGEQGTMLIFGHSSYLPVVKNKAFQAFNELGTLKQGDRITVYSRTHAFEYQVERVSLMRAEDTVVWLDADVPELMLSTCNTFGSKDERWVVHASYVGMQPL